MIDLQDQSKLLLMKKNALKLTIAISMLAAIYGCAKDGDTGPQGEKGEPGVDGTKGDKGDNGADGNRIHSGSGIPSMSVGEIGDFYIDLTNRNFYGPKNDTGWGNPTSLGSNQSATSYVYAIQAQEWRKVSNVKFECILTIPELDKSIFEDGHVLLSISTNDDPENYVLVPGNLKEFQISASYSVGRIVLQKEYKAGNIPPKLEDSILKVVLSEAKIGN